MRIQTLPAFYPVSLSLGLHLQFGNTALHEAAWNGNNDIVKILLGAYCFVDSLNHTGFTPLHLASQNGHAKVAKTLLKWRADPTLLNQVGTSCMLRPREAGLYLGMGGLAPPLCARCEQLASMLH